MPADGKSARDAIDVDAELGTADGRLSREEAAAHSVTAQRFQQLDVNKDGFLSRDELASEAAQLLRSVRS